MQIKVGNYDLIHSGFVIGIKDNPISIKLPDEIEGDYTFIINFISDKVNNEPSTNYTIIDKFTLQINLKNLDGFFGGGNTELINLGTLRNRLLYFNYRVFDLANSGKSLMFNFYCGKEEQHGN